MKLFGWPADSGGCAWYRIIAPLTTLGQDDDTDVLINSEMPRHIVDDHDWKIVLQRSTNPTAMLALEFFQERGRGWIYDIDDLLWAVEPSNPAYQYYSQPIIRRRIQWHMKNAAVATASTEDLAEEMRAFGAENVHVLPNTLPRRVVDNIAKILNDTPRNDKITVFWRGSPTHQSDIKAIRYAMSRIGKMDNVRIILAGTDYRKELDIPNAEFMTWQQDPEQYLYEVAKLRPDITLCPLAPNRFNYSKSHVNALEAAAVGAIPVCSNTQAYKFFVRDGTNGFLISSREHDWYSTVRDLINAEPEQRSALQDEALKSTETFITENWKDEYLNVYRTID